MKQKVCCHVSWQNKKYAQAFFPSSSSTLFYALQFAIFFSPSIPKLLSFNLVSKFIQSKGSEVGDDEYTTQLLGQELLNARATTTKKRRRKSGDAARGRNAETNILYSFS